MITKDQMEEVFARAESVSEAAEMLGVGRQLLDYYEQKFGIKAKRRSNDVRKEEANDRRGDEEKRIIDNFVPGMTRKEALAAAGVPLNSGKFSKKYLEEQLGLDIGSRYKDPDLRRRAQIKRDLIAASEMGMNKSQAAEYAGVCYTSIYRYIKVLGLEHLDFPRHGLR